MKRLLSLTVLGLFTLTAHARLDAITLGYGVGEPNFLKGGRIALQWDWPRTFFKDKPIVVSGYWEYSLSQWFTDGNRNGDNKNLTTIAVAPIFRFQANPNTFTRIIPYIEGSIGLSLHSRPVIGRRELGGNFAFQDLAGAGIIFGKRHEFDLSYHYIHYSHANLFGDNDGVDIQGLFSLTYHLPPAGSETA